MPQTVVKHSAQLFQIADALFCLNLAWMSELSRRCLLDYCLLNYCLLDYCLLDYCLLAHRLGYLPLGYLLSRLTQFV